MGCMPTISTNMFFVNAHSVVNVADYHLTGLTGLEKWSYLRNGIML